MENENWIQQIFDEKQAQADVDNLEAATELERRTQFASRADAFRNQLAALLSKTVDNYNGHVSSNAQRVQYTVPIHLVFEAFKSQDPSGHLTVELNKDTEKLICEYQYSDADTTHADRLTLKVAAVNNHLQLKLEERVIPEDDVAEAVLSDFFRKVCSI